MYICIIVYVFIAFTLDHKTNDIDSESFEMFYQKYQEQVILY